MWTNEEIETLKNNYGQMDIRDIPLTKTINAIRHKASRLSLYKDQSLESRFFAKVIKTESCWLWKTRGRRYGSIKDGNKTKSINRVSWEIHFGPIPEGLEVCHTCDNTFCVNPGHLFLGTHEDNMKDMKSKGRSNGGSPPGENCGSSKLTNEQVIEIRRLGSLDLSHQKIAERFNVSRRTIGFIINKETWRHI